MNFPSLRHEMAAILVVLGIFLSLPQKISARDEVVFIQAVTKGGRSFVIRRGHAEGVKKNQESLFSTPNASLVAVVQEINRHFSLWEMKETKGAVPFKKGEGVIYSNSVLGIWNQIPKYQWGIYLESRRKLTFKPHNRWIFKGHYSYSLSESISETDNDRYLGRAGWQVSFLWGRRFAPYWEYALGIRGESESSALKNPGIDIPTWRAMLTGEITYHFNIFQASLKNNFYLGAGLAYGYSRTTVADKISKGKALILPIAKVGYINQMAPSYALVFEFTLESIAADEVLPDGRSQSTHVVQSAWGVGVRF